MVLLFNIAVARRWLGTLRTRTASVAGVQLTLGTVGAGIMSELEKLEERIEKLSPEELKKFRGRT